MKSACLHTQINDMQCHIILQTDGYKNKEICGQHMIIYMAVQKKLDEMLIQNSLHLILNIAGTLFYIHRGDLENNS